MKEFDDECTNLDPDVHLFKGDPCEVTVPFWTRLQTPLGFAGVALFASVIRNSVLKKPLISGIQRHILYTTVAFLGGSLLDDFRVRREAERDRLYYDYMTTHPQDFQAPVRIKYRDYIEPWVPIR